MSGQEKTPHAQQRCGGVSILHRMEREKRERGTVVKGNESGRLGYTRKMFRQRSTVRAHEQRRSIAGIRDRERPAVLQSSSRKDTIFASFGIRVDNEAAMDSHAQ